MVVKSVIDQMGNEVTFSFPPKRIISLVPSQTELLADLGLDDFVAGITKFCVHPPSWLGTKTIIGGTKNFNFDIIEQLSPDLIIANKEENYKEGIERLQAKFPVWISDITTFRDALDMITGVGAITGKEDKALEITGKIEREFKGLIKHTQKSVLYLIWKKPWMAAGQKTFINTLLEKTGLQNCLTASRYPELTDADIRSLKPDLIFLSSEPYPFKEKHIDELKALSPSSQIMLVDGEMFSWYGSRLVQAPAYFNTLKLQ